MATRIQHRRGTTAEWVADDEVLADGQIGVEFREDGNHFIRIGDGIRPWSQLPNQVGPQGIQGIQGPQGNQGVQGNQGIQGNPGTPGEKWFSWATDVNNADGIVGDWGITLDDGDIYEKTGAAAWTLRGNIRGPQGIQGPQGDQGIQGVQGPAAPMENAFLSKSSQSIAHNTVTVIAFDAFGAGDNDDNFYVYNAGRTTIKPSAGGLFLFTADGHWATNATGVRYFILRKFASGDLVARAYNSALSGFQTPLQASRVVRLAANEEIEMVVYQNCGGNASISAITVSITRLKV